MESQSDIASKPLPKSPASSLQYDVVPQMIIRSSNVRPREFAIGDAKRVLQHYLPRRDMPLFDHLIGAGEQCRWHGETKRFCDLHHQLELGRLLDRQVARLRTLENPIDESGGPTIKISNFGSLAQKESPHPPTRSASSGGP
jgi:hypothetical protein